MRDYRNIVVGGGISGMTAALLLARQGGKTALLESFPQLGPTVRGFRCAGVHFETGVHLLGGLGHNHPLDIYFRHLDISAALEKIPFAQNGYDCFRYERQGREIRMPFGYRNIHEILCREFPQESAAIEKYLDKIKSTFNSSPYLNFNLNFSFDGAVHHEQGSLNEYLDSITANRELKDLLSYPCMLYGTPPAEAMLSTHSLVAGSYAMSCHTVEGGGLSIVRALRNQLRRHGVDILCGQKVRKIRSGADREFNSVILQDGTEISADFCIWTAHPAAMLDCAGEKGFRPAFRKRIAALEETPSALILFGIASTPLPELVRRNIYLWPGGDYSRILKGKEKLSDNAVFISATQTEKSTPQAVTAIAPFDFQHFKAWSGSSPQNRPQGYLDFKMRLKEEFERTLAKRCPELKGRVEFVDFATPLTLRNYCSSPYGSMYGAAHTVSQYNPLPVTKIKGLFMAGQSIIAPGVMGAVVSAYLTCGIICGHEQIHEELRCIYNG